MTNSLREKVMLLAFFGACYAFCVKHESADVRKVEKVVWVFRFGNS